MALSFQSVDVTGQTNSRGQLSYFFDNPVDQVHATVNLPDAGVFCTATLVGEKEVSIRCWRHNLVFANRSVTIALLGAKHSSASAAEKSSVKADG